ncbi:MAG: hypothetical protein OXL34_15530 [Gemmatimonadota bacterium]|nr:hypothetical protein [Gemmatimonadota bacterium]
MARRIRGVRVAALVAAPGTFLSACVEGDHAGPVVRSVVVDTIPPGEVAITGGTVACE